MSPGVVQTASASGSSGSSLTITLGTAATAGNCLVVNVATEHSTSITVHGITIGGSADNWALGEAETGGTGAIHLDVEIWTDQDIGESSTSVVVTFTGAISECFCWVEEWSGIKTSGAVDQVNKAAAASSSFSVATGTLSQSSEAVLGALVYYGSLGAPTITGPGSPWTNLSELSAVSFSMIASYETVSATTAQTYSGSASGGSDYAAVIVSLEAASGTPHTDTASLTVTPSFTAEAVHGHYRTASLTVTPSFTAGRSRGRYRTASLEVTPAFTAGRSRGNARHASLTVEPSFTAKRVQGHARQASLTVDPVFTASGVASGAQSRTAALTITPMFTATAEVNHVHVPPTVRYPYHHRAADR